ncbi:Ctage Family Member 2 [Manis pentadactyla]|nr:Ctage Family Member 2 [Manis pentadactyla]
MEGLLPAAGLMCQLILECLLGALLVIVRAWNSRRTEAQGRSCSARQEVPGNCGDTAERTTPADDAGRPPAGKASPPTVQSLSLAVVAMHLRLSLQIVLDLLAKGSGSQPPTLPKATDAKPTLRASQKDGEQPAKEMLDDWKGNTAFPGRAEVLAQNIARCRQRLEEKEGEKEGLLRSDTRLEQDLKEGVSLLLSVAETLLHAVPPPAPLRHLLDGGGLEVKQKREAGNCKHPVPGSEVALRADVNDADAPVSPHSPEGARSLRERKEVGEELRKRTAALLADQLSLRGEIRQLRSQILQLKPQSLLEQHQERTMPLESQFAEEEKRSAEMEKKLINLRRNWNSKSQILQLRNKTAEDTGKESETTSPFHPTELLLHEKRAQKSWEAAVRTESDLLKIRGEGDHITQMLADAQAHLQPFPTGPSARVAPCAAHGGHKLSGDPLNPQAPQEGGGCHHESPGSWGDLQV